jgi:hypothetical protein
MEAISGISVKSDSITHIFEKSSEKCSGVINESPYLDISHPCINDMGIQVRNGILQSNKWVKIRKGNNLTIKVCNSSSKFST